MEKNKISLIGNQLNKINADGIFVCSYDLFASEIKGDLFAIKEIAEITKCGECNSCKCKHVAKPHLDKLKKHLDDARNKILQLLQSPQISDKNRIKFDVKSMMEIWNRANLFMVVNDNTFEYYVEWIKNFISDYMNFDEIEIMKSYQSNIEDELNDFSRFFSKAVDVIEDYNKRRTLLFTLTKSIIDTFNGKKLSKFENIEKLAVAILSTVRLSNFSLRTIDDFNALISFLYNELSIKNGKLDAEAIKKILSCIDFVYDIKASKCFDLLKLQSKNDLSPSILFTFMENVIGEKFKIYKSDIDAMLKFLKEMLEEINDREEKQKLINEYNLVFDDVDKLYKPRLKHGNSVPPLEISRNVVPLLEDWARLNFDDIVSLLTFGENYVLPDSGDANYKYEIDAFLQLLNLIFKKTKGCLDIAVVSKVFDFINSKMKIELPEDIHKNYYWQRLSGRLSENLNLAISYSNNLLRVGPCLKPFLISKIGDYISSVDNIAKCSMCHSRACEHVIKSYFDKLNGFINDVRDNFVKALPNRNIDDEEEFNLVIGSMTMFLKKMDLLKIVNDDNFQIYVEGLKSIFDNQVKISTTLSKELIIDGMQSLFEAIYNMLMNHKNKYKLNLILIETVINKVKNSKNSNFTDMECLSAIVKNQGIEPIRTFDDFEVFIEFLHKNLGIQDGLLDSKLIDDILDFIYVEYDIDPRDCLGLLRLSKNNDLSPSIFLKFFGRMKGNYNAYGVADNDHIYVESVCKDITKKVKTWNNKDRQKLLKDIVVLGDPDIIIDDSGICKPKENAFVRSVRYNCQCVIQKLVVPYVKLGYDDIANLLSFGKNYILPEPLGDEKYRDECRSFFKLLDWLFDNQKEELNQAFIQWVLDYINTNMKIELSKDCISEFNNIIIKNYGVEIVVSENKLKTKLVFDSFIKSRICARICNKLHPDKYHNNNTHGINVKQYISKLEEYIKNVKDKFLEFSSDNNIIDKNQLKFDIKQFTAILLKHKNKYTEIDCFVHGEFESYVKRLQNIIKNDILINEKPTTEDIAAFLKAVTHDVCVIVDNSSYVQLRLKTDLLNTINSVAKLNLAIEDFVSASEISQGIDGFQPNIDDTKFLFKFIRDKKLKDVTLKQIDHLLDKLISQVHGYFLSYDSEYTTKAMEYLQDMFSIFEKNMSEIFRSLVAKCKAGHAQNQGAESNWKQILKFVDNKMLKALGLKISIDENAHVEIQQDITAIDSCNYDYNYREVVGSVLMSKGQEGLKFLIQKYPYDKDGEDNFLQLSSNESKQKFINAASEIFFDIASMSPNSAKSPAVQIFESVEYLISRNEGNKFFDWGYQRFYSMRQEIMNSLKGHKCLEKCNDTVRKSLSCWIESFWAFDMEARTEVLDAMLKAKEGRLGISDLEKINLFLIQHFTFKLKPEETFAHKNKPKKPPTCGLTTSNLAASGALSKVISFSVHNLVNSKNSDNEKNSKFQITVDDIFIATQVRDDMYNQIDIDYRNHSYYHFKDDAKQICGKMADIYFNKEIETLFEKFRNKQTDENVFKRVIKRHSKILTALSDSEIKIISVEEEKRKRQFIINQIKDLIISHVNNIDKNLDENALKEEIARCFEAFFVMDVMMDKKELEKERIDMVKIVDRTLREKIIGKDVIEYSKQIMNTSSDEYDLQKIIDKYRRISDAFSASAWIQENEAEEIKKNICHAIKETAIGFIETDLKNVCEEILNGNSKQLNLQEIQDKYNKMLDTLCANGTVFLRIVKQIKQDIKKSIEETVKKINSVNQKIEQVENNLDDEQNINRERIPFIKDKNNKKLQGQTSSDTNGIKNEESQKKIDKDATPTTTENSSSLQSKKVTHDNQGIAPNKTMINTKSKWPKILDKAGKYSVVIGGLSFIVLIVLYILLNISPGYVFSPFLLVALGGVMWKLGTCSNNKAVSDIKIVEEPLDNPNGSFINKKFEHANQSEKPASQPTKNQDKNIMDIGGNH